jgi:hypothetical protein
MTAPAVREETVRAELVEALRRRFDKLSANGGVGTQDGFVSCELPMICRRALFEQKPFGLSPSKPCARASAGLS